MYSASRTVYRALSLLAGSLAAASSFAVLGNTLLGTTPTNSTDALAASDLHYTAVGQVGSASCVAIGPYALLTSAHVVAGGQGAGGSVRVNGVTYNITSTVAAPLYDTGVPDPNHPGSTYKSFTDLTMIFVQKDKGVLPYTTIATSTSAASLTMVGYGSTGFSASSTDLQYNPINTPAGTRRAADNPNLAKDFYYVDPSSITKPEDKTGGGPLLTSDLHARGQALLGVNDSGGGFFQGDTLVGINSFVYNNTPTSATTVKYGGDGFGLHYGDSYTLSDYFPQYKNTPQDYTLHGASAPGGIGDAYIGSAAINLTDPQLRSFLAQANPVPEPSTIAALALGALAILRRRRRA